MDFGINHAHKPSQANKQTNKQRKKQRNTETTKQQRNKERKKERKKQTTGHGKNQFKQCASNDEIETSAWIWTSCFPSKYPRCTLLDMQKSQKASMTSYATEFPCKTWHSSPPVATAPCRWATHCMKKEMLKRDHVSSLTKPQSHHTFGGAGDRKPVGLWKIALSLPYQEGITMSCSQPYPLRHMLLSRQMAKSHKRFPPLRASNFRSVKCSWDAMVTGSR